MSYHDPVMLDECMEGLSVRQDGTYVDVTFGGGGHSAALLSRLGPQGKLIAFDQDPDAAANAVNDPRFQLVKDNFRTMHQHLRDLQALPVDGILADLGVSSHQFDTPVRGFAFRFNHDLNMRMDRGSGHTAQHILQEYTHGELTRMFRELGELPQASKIAAAILAARELHPIDSSESLRLALGKLVPKQNENQIMARIYQALRIEANDELGALADLLVQSAQVLRSGGRLCVIAYHSLEDRMVKNFVRCGNLSGEIHKDIYGNTVGLTFHQVGRKPLVPSPEEQARNPRSRSARLRIAERNNAMA